MNKTVLRTFAIIVLLVFVLGCSNTAQTPTLLSIEVSTKPAKLDYMAGECLDLTGMTVTALYSNGQTSSIKGDQYTVTPADGTRLETEGEVSVVVSFEKKNAAFNICVSTSTFGERLKKIEGISSVTEIQQEASPAFREKYMVTFTQPIDWNDLSKGTFEQRVEIGIQGSYNVNEYNVGGYCFKDILTGAGDIFKKDDRDELTKKYNGNLINIEYRFFGKSIPEGLSNDRTALWDCLTVEYAAKDFNSILEKLSTVLKGKTIFTGVSKGGFTANTMAYYYPKSFDAFVAYVAPLCDGKEDARFIKNIYETIGDIGYPAQEAAAKRKTVLDFQVYCIENRAALEDMYYQSAMEAGCTYRDTVTKEILWDMAVVDFAGGYWQYGHDINKLDTILAMPETTATERSEKNNEAFSTVLKIVEPDGWSTSSIYFPYFWQSMVEMGNYSYDFSYLRAAVIAETGEDMLAVKEEDEKGLFEKMLFTSSQQRKLIYDSSIRDALIDWSATTDAHVIMIYGGCDIWYAVRIPECNNKNVHTYRVDSGCHYSNISQLNEKDKTECEDLLDKWLL